MVCVDCLSWLWSFGAVGCAAPGLGALGLRPLRANKLGG